MKKNCLRKCNIKKENGSVTMYVLVALIFFLIIGVTIFVGIRNKLEAQEAQIEEIIRNYEKDIEEIYNNAKKDLIYILLRTPDGKMHLENSWTKENLTVEIYYPEGISEADKLVKLDDGGYINYTGPFTVTQKTKITGKVRNSKEKSAIAKIDKTAPSYTTNPVDAMYAVDVNSNVTDVVISINASDEESGVKKIEYSFLEDDSTPISYTEMKNGEVLTFKSKTQGSYYLWLKIEDNVGNIKNEKVEIGVIEYVARIGDKYYITLQQAIDECPTNGTATEIDIIKPITYKPNGIIPKGANITIDLNGYGITGKGTIIENNGTLTIIDSNSANTGNITSEDGTVVQNNGNFTLGINDGIVNQTSPIFTGENIVVNTTGTFNYYDGVLVANKAIEGNITKIPDEYSVISKKQGDKEKVYLGVLAESAAKIGKWFYNTLDEAIADCPIDAGEEKTTITILRDLSLLSKASIDSGKNIVLDLNGHSITSTTTDYVIENSATLEITDSTETKLGMINGINDSAVLNNRNSSLSLSSGGISLSKTGSSSKYTSALRNEGKFLLKDGNIKTTQSSYTYAVYNNGDMQTTGGEINATGIAVYNTNDKYLEEDSDFKDINIKNVAKNGTYYFEDDGTGKLIPTNKGVNSSVANSYLEIDLTNKTDTFAIEINAEISSEGPDYGYATVTENTTAPAYNFSMGRFMYISGTKQATNYSTELQGGKKYYLHLGYRKDGSVHTGNDCITVNSVKLGKYEETLGNLEFNATSIIGSTGIYNDAKTSVIVNNVNVNTSSYGIYNNNLGKIEINGGIVTTTNTKSSTTYVIYNNSNGQININKVVISLNSASSYDNTTASVIYNNAGGEINITLSTMTADSIYTNPGYIYGIYNNSDGKINMNSGSLSVTQSKSSSSYACAIYNKETGEINIGINDDQLNNNSIAIKAKDRCISNFKGSINWYDGSIESIKVIEGKITSIPKDTEVEYSEFEDNIGKAILICINTPVASTNGIEYDTLQEAFDSVKDNQEEKTIVNLLRNVSILTEEDKTIIGTAKNIYLNMAQYTITTFNDKGIENQGKLEIGNNNQFITMMDNPIESENDYGFIINENGKIVSNNSYILNSLAASYMKIDLTNEIGSYILNINAEISSEIGYGIGYATITETQEKPSTPYCDSTLKGEFMKISGDLPATDYIQELQGGRIYYLNLGYYESKINDKKKDCLTINSIDLIQTGTLSAKGSNCITNFGDLILAEGILVKTSLSEQKAIVNTGGILSINGGNIISKTCGIYNEKNANITINDGNILLKSDAINSEVHSIYNADNSIINMNGGNINTLAVRSKTYMLYNESSGKINMNGGMISYYSGSNAYGIYNNSNGGIVLNSGTIYGTSTDTVYGIYNKENGIIELNDGKILIFIPESSSDNAYALFNTSGSINLYSGTIIVSKSRSKYNTSNDPNLYGVFNENGILSMGINNEYIDTELLKIQVKASESISQGISNNYVFNYYDGIIIGKKSISGEITEIPDGCDVIKINEGNLEKAILDNSPVASIGNITFSSLQKAFDATEDNKEDPTVIKLLRDTTILNENYAPIIEKSKNICIDFNGYKIFAENESGIKNNGKLKLGMDNINLESSQIIKSGDYYFTRNEDSTITPSNSSIKNSIADSYIEIDLTNKNSQQLVVNAEMLGATSTSSIGYGIISESLQKPDFNSTVGRFIYISNIKSSNDYIANLEGGKKYYLHLRYRNYYSIDTVFKINYMRLQPYGEIQSMNNSCITNSGELIILDGTTLTTSECEGNIINNSGRLNLNGGDIIYEMNGTYPSSYAYGIYNTGELNMTGGNIFLETSYYSNTLTYGIYNTNEGVVNINDGNIKSHSIGDSSIGIYSNSINSVNIRGGNLTCFSKDNTATAVSNNSSGSVNILGENIITSSGRRGAYGIYNISNGTINMLAGELNSISTDTSNKQTIYGIYNTNNGEVNITGGKIITKTYYIDSISYGIYNSGKLVLGKKDNIVNTTSPDILAENKSYGIYNLGTFNFYDGKIVGKESISGEITKIEENYNVIKEIENNIETTILDNSPVAQIGETKYLTLQKAIDAVNEDINNFTDIMLLKNICIINNIERPIIKNNQKIRINLNGHIISNSNSIGIENQGELEIINDSKLHTYTPDELVVNGEYFFEDDGTGKLIPNNTIGETIASSYIKIDLTNDMSLYDLTISAEINGYIYNYGYANITEDTKAPSYNDSKGQFMMIKGNVMTNNYTTSLKGGKIYYLHLGYYMKSNSSNYNNIMKINSISFQSTGKITATSETGITNYGNLILSEGGVVVSNSNKINKYAVNNSGELNIIGGKIISNEYGIYNDGGIINFERGEIKVITDESSSAYGIYNCNAGNVNIKDCNIVTISRTSGSSYGLYNMQEGMINICGGKIETYKLNSNTNYYNAYGIYNMDNGEIQIDDIDLYTKTVNGNSAGIYNNKGMLNLNAGKIIVEKTLSSSTDAIYGIYNSNYSTAIIKKATINSISNSISHGIYNLGNTTIGMNDKNVNTVIPEIIATSVSGNSYGISNTGTFNFYDGRISAETATISGNITEVAPGYEIKKSTKDGISTDILALSATDNTVCVMNSINYSTIQEAVDACTGTDNYTISLTNTCELANPITIPSGKNIMFSINGFDIHYNGSDSMFINNGTLTIKDTNTVASGEIINEVGSIVENNGTLIIGENDGSVTSRSPHLIGKDIAIINNRSIQFYDGTITATTPVSGSIIGTIPSDYNIIETTNGENKTLSLVGIAPNITYITEAVSGGTKITVTATDTNLSKVINLDDTEVIGSDTEIISEYMVTNSGVYTFKAMDKNNNITTIDVAI